MNYLLKNSPWMGGEVGVSVFAELLQRHGAGKIASGTEQLRRMTTVGGQKILSMGQWFGKWGGPAVSGVGAAFGFHDDVTNQDKTNGEAFVHNGTTLGVGLLAGVYAATLITPVGWAVVGAGAVGTGAAAGFKYLYQTNWMGIQNGLDAVGRGVDFIAEGVWNFAKNPGEAIQNGVNLVNEQS